MRSVMKHSFAEVPRANIPRSSFNRSHGYKTTFDADYLIPVLVDDVVPGDTVNCNMNFFTRLTSPFVFPVMDNLYIESFFFFVPYRLVWDNWTKMHGEQDNPADSIDFTVPVISGGGSILSGDLGHYFGLPYALDPAVTTDISALPGRAYRLIWNEWFRDQNLQDSLTVPTDNGPDSAAEHEYDEVPKKRGKRHDYFTSCLPWPQKGDAVSIFSSADVQTGASVGANMGVYVDSLADHTVMASGTPTYLQTTNVVTNAEAGKMYVQQSDTINDLRLAFQTQRLLERDARSGTRYNELILAHYGVTVPDFRVQRPEFLGGGSTPIMINPVAQTTYQGTATLEDVKGGLSGIGTASDRHGFTKSFTEHGILLGLVNVRADLTYSQGVERYWQKSTRYDFYYPVLAQIGEQTVLNQELYHDVAGTNNTDVFGYQERYAEYRYKPSRLTGLFGVDVPSNLDEWHLSEDFASLPTLGDTFIQSSSSSPIDRAISVPSEPQFVFDAYFDYKWARPMPLFGVPGNLDHF